MHFVCEYELVNRLCCLLLHSFDVSKQTPLLAEANADSEDNYDYPEAQADLSVTAGSSLHQIYVSMMFLSVMGKKSKRFISA
ncbi:hypothetical protein T4C_10211 [Trichinella pseudospiralis]|uniref:Uncharacterized protein n=1 Tax=Trichinella pseudospiralis TaxID=6337 RepID=A0A0V1ICC2_TRIPS|nr:hypothetical protein T4C_10211 [Trichinella pseudospiralis]